MAPDYRNRTGSFNRQIGGRGAGFTLIELMMTIVILSILVSIALPMYLRQVRESRRTDARTALMDLAGREERYYATNNNYSNSASALGYGSLSWPVSVGSGFYTIAQPTIPDPNATAPSFAIVASPVAGKGQDRDTTCASFTIESTGKQSALDSSGADQSSTCWGQ
jgi:type IV pilus assembly protein PilE